ncbi:MAG: hypothetical protein KDE20_24235, partial [Caldilineaceae bacterium]|nr:hypothetical protein [Caldilineaceae bacterium]
AVAGAIQSGTVEGAAWGAFSAAVFYGIGQGIKNAGSLWEGAEGAKTLTGTGLAVKTVSHGIAGGTISYFQGGKFGNGFLSAAGSAAFTPIADTSSAKAAWGSAIAASLAGGTVSRISGGKFGNGAVTAAMVFAFNQMQELRLKTMVQDQGVVVVPVSTNNDANGYLTVDDAVLAQYTTFKNEYAAASKRGNELLGAVIKRGNMYLFSDVAEVDPQFTGQLKVKGGILPGDDYAAFTHTHDNSSSHSGLDYRLPSASGKPYYVRNNGGDVFAWPARYARKYENYVRSLEGGNANRPYESQIDRYKWKIREVCRGCVR